MSKGAYYSENDSFAAAWLREFIKEGVICDGEVDERSIEDVVPEEIRGFCQYHLFSGIGVWSYALRCAGWEDRRPCLTVSCPCQPYSAAGKGGGMFDERHLWPAAFHVISGLRDKVPCIFGEQVVGAIKHGWSDLVEDDLEGIGYSFWAEAFPACSVGAWHKRERLYFAATWRNLANPAELRRDGRRGATSVALQGQCAERSGERARSGDDGELSGRLEGLCGVDELADSERPTAEPWRTAIESRESNGTASAGTSIELGRCGDSSSLVQPHSPRPQPGRTATEGMGYGSAVESAGGAIVLEITNGLQPEQLEGQRPRPREADSGRPCGELAGRSEIDNPWANPLWLPCRDGKYRPVQRSTKPGPIALASGTPGDLGYCRLASEAGEETWIVAPLIEKGKNRVGRLRGYGNSLVVKQAQVFIESYLDAQDVLDTAPPSM